MNCGAFAKPLGGSVCLNDSDMRFRFFLTAEKRMYQPEEIEVTFSGERVTIKVATVKAGLNLVIPVQAGILMRSSGMLDASGVEGFDGDVVRFPHFKKGDRTKPNGSAYRPLIWEEDRSSWSMESIARGFIVKNIYQK